MIILLKAMYSLLLKGIVACVHVLWRAGNKAEKPITKNPKTNERKQTPGIISFNGAITLYSLSSIPLLFANLMDGPFITLYKYPNSNNFPLDTTISCLQSVKKSLPKDAFQQDHFCTFMFIVKSTI